MESNGFVYDSTLLYFCGQRKKHFTQIVRNKQKPCCGDQSDSEAKYCMMIFKTLVRPAVVLLLAFGGSFANTENLEASLTEDKSFWLRQLQGTSMPKPPAPTGISPPTSSAPVPTVPGDGPVPTVPGEGPVPTVAGEGCARELESCESRSCCRGLFCVRNFCLDDP